MFMLLTEVAMGREAAVGDASDEKVADSAGSTLLLSASAPACGAT